MRNRRSRIRRGLILDEPILSRWRFRILLAPDGDPAGGGGGGGGGAPAQEPPDVPPQTGDPNQVDPASRGGFNPSEGDPTQANRGGGGGGQPRQAPADPNNRAGVVNPPAQQQQQQGAADGWQSIRDAATAYGYQVPQHIQDDQAFLGHLLQAANQNRQADYFAQLGRQLAPQAPAIQQYLQQQRQPQQPERPAWEAPEFDERWLSLTERDEGTGLFVSKPGVPHEIAQKLNQYAEWKRNYDRNPAAVINGMVEARSRAIASETFQQQFAAATREQQVNSILQANANWMYQADASGRPIINPMTNQPQLTPVGAAYAQQLQILHAAGVRDPVTQDRIARQILQGQYAQSGQQQQQQNDGRGADPQRRQAQNRPNTNPIQTLPSQQRQGQQGATEPSTAGMSLDEMLRQEMAAHGITDDDINRSLSGE